MDFVHWGVLRFPRGLRLGTSVKVDIDEHFYEERNDKRRITQLSRDESARFSLFRQRIQLLRLQAFSYFHHSRSLFAALRFAIRPGHILIVERNG